MADKSSNKSKDINFDEVEIVESQNMSSDKPLKLSVIEKREDNRGRIAQIFIIGFFISLFGVSMIGLFVDPLEGVSRVDNFREIILTVSGVLSGPLGFIIGYYFRRSEE